MARSRVKRDEKSEVDEVEQLVWIEVGGVRFEPPNPGKIYHGATCWYLTDQADCRLAVFQMWLAECRALVVDVERGSPKIVEHNHLSFFTVNPLLKKVEPKPNA